MNEKEILEMCDSIKTILPTFGGIFWRNINDKHRIIDGTNYVYFGLRIAKLQNKDELFYKTVKITDYVLSKPDTVIIGLRFWVLYYQKEHINRYIRVPLEISYDWVKTLMDADCILTAILSAYRITIPWKATDNDIKDALVGSHADKLTAYPIKIDLRCNDITYTGVVLVINKYKKNMVGIKLNSYDAAIMTYIKENSKIIHYK
jgi:hypothetical protein